MTSLEHDGAASLCVKWVGTSNGQVGVFHGRPTRVAGWYVVRTCPCHKDEEITAPLDSREDAVVALAMLNDDARNHQ